MMKQYQLQNGLDGKPCAVIVHEGDVTHNIPFDPNNTDYQIYLDWVAQGNTPLPANDE